MKKMMFVLMAVLPCLLMAQNSVVEPAAPAETTFDAYTYPEASLLAELSDVSDKKVSKDCTYKGKVLKGKVKVVSSFPDFKVKIVESFPDLKVKSVSSFPDRCGEWQFVESFPDFTVQFVESFPDFTIKFVESFPGVK